jgi:protein O-mannosyl-transferase
LNTSAQTKLNLEPGTNRREWLIALLLVLVTVLLYHSVFHFGFVNYDDDDYVVQNLHVQKGLTPDNAAWAFTSGYACNWHPLTWLSHMLDCQFYGLGHPGGHHLTNLLFHVANALLLFAWLFRVTGARWRSAFVAALFAWHPLHVESVAWIAERKDVLSTFFWLLTMHAYVRYAQKPSFPRYLPVLVLLAFGLMSKPMVVTLPCVLILLDFWPLCRIADKKFQILPAPGPHPFPPLSIPRLVLEKAPLFLLAAASSVITYLVQQKGGAVATANDLSLASRAANALVSYCRYLGKTFWPAHLAAPYPYHGAWSIGSVAGAALLLLGITLWACLQMRRRPYLLVGWLWFLGTLVPVLGLVQVGGASMADRYTYIPMIGLLLMVAWVLPDLLSPMKRFKWPLASASAVVILACLALTSRQIQYWSSSEALFRHALAVTPDNADIRYYIASTLALEGKSAEALAEYNQALQINPAHYRARCNLARLLVQMGRLDEAMPQYSKVLQTNPGYAKAHDGLGFILARQGKIPDAIAEYQQALKINPNSAESRNNLGSAFESQGKLDEARTQFTEALRINPRFAEAHYNLGNLLATQGRFEDARFQLSEALHLRPDYADAQSRLGLLLASKGDLDASAKSFHELVRLRPSDADAYFNQGVVLAEAGRAADASNSFAAALKIQPDLAEKYKSNAESFTQQGNLPAAASSYQGALRLKPDDAAAHKQLGLLLAQQGNFPDAVLQFAEAVRLKPDDADATYNLAMAFDASGQSESAVKYYRAANRLKPDSPNTLNNLAWILSTHSDASLRNGPEAVQLAERACELTGRSQAMLLGTLAAAYAEAGRFPDAITAARKARELALAAGQTELASKNEELLKSYEANHPYHEAPPAASAKP